MTRVLSTNPNAVRMRERRRNDPAYRVRDLAKVREYQAKHPFKKRKWKKDYDYAQYGWDESRYLAEVAQRNGCCDICHQPPSGKGRAGKLHVDHDHGKQKGEPGFIRGLLCPNCNMVLGHSHDNVLVLESAVHYLQRVQAD